MKTEILLQKESAFVFDKRLSSLNTHIAATFQSELMNIGYMLSESAYYKMTTASVEDITEIFHTLLPVLNKLRGSDVTHKPMYKNFPREVMNMSHIDLYINAMMHYWSRGQWSPDSEGVMRECGFEATTYTILNCVNESRADELLKNIICAIVQSNESISETDKTYVKWYLSDGRSLGEISFKYKENMCFVAGVLFENNRNDVTSLLQTSTDILRFVTYLSDGDVSLSENCRFKSLSRPLRRKLVTILENCINEDDISRHKNKWKRLFHGLHVGDYKNIAPKSVSIAQRVRNNEKLSTFNGKVETAISNENCNEVLNLLVQKPGEFHRRLDHLLRLFPDDNGYVVDKYESVVHKIPVRLLTRLSAHFSQRNLSEKMYVFPKGISQSGVIIDRKGKINDDIVQRLCGIISNQIRLYFEQLPDIGKCWIDPNLKMCPLPTQQRSALGMVARGTKFDMGKKKFLRFFVYWIGKDIDLSATFHDDNFQNFHHISYTNLTDGDTYHSGDIVNADNGATEFIDVDVGASLKKGHRYITMNVLVYNGPTFKEHEQVFAGWMSLDQPGCNNQFQPAQVQQKIDLTADTYSMIPVIFDLKERKVIWTDLQCTPIFGKSNNVENNRISTEKSLDIITNLSNNTFTLHDLFSLHANARGVLVENPKDADIRFGFGKECDVTPRDINVINSQYIC